MRATQLFGVSALCLASLGCYTLKRNMDSAPDAGVRVALDINDAGRLALGGSMGPEIAQIEGRLVETSNGEYVIGVTVVRLLRGGLQAWTGELVRVKVEHVSSVYERQFSRGRSIALGAATMGGVTAFLISRNLIGSGSAGDPPVPGDTGASARGRP